MLKVSNGLGWKNCDLTKIGIFFVQSDSLELFIKSIIQKFKNEVLS